MISETEMSPSLPCTVSDPKQEMGENGVRQSPASGRLRKEVLKFKAGLDYKTSPRLV